MRHLIAILALALSACASVPDRADPNLLAQLQSAENQRRDIAAAEQARATANAEAIKACATAADQSACFMGVALVNGAGNARAAEQPVIAPYTPPPSFGAQVRDLLIGFAPIAQGAFNMASQNRANELNAKTSQVIATVNAGRETATVQAITGLGGTIATTDAARAPAIQIGAGGVYSAGDVTQNAAGRDLVTGTQTVTNTSVGRDQTGGNHTEDRHDSVTCIAGNGGPGGSTGDPNAGGASGVGGAGAAGGSACH